MRPIALLALMVVFGLAGFAWLSSQTSAGKGLARRADASGVATEEPRPSVKLDAVDARSEGRGAGPLGTVSQLDSSDEGGESTSIPDKAPDDTGALLSVAPPGVAPVEEELLALASISGVLRHEAGMFSRTPREITRAVHLDIVACRRDQNEARVELPGPILEPQLDEDGHVIAVAFTFHGLQQDQQYEITLSTVDHQRWSGPSVREYAPNESVEFICYGDDDSVPLTFVVTDAATGEAIDSDWSASEIRITSSDENGVLMHAAPLNLDDFPVDGNIEWAIEADGYRPAFGDRDAFDRDPETGALTASVELERGFAARLIVLGRAPDRVLAQGARVEVDGRLVGHTNANGSLMLATDEAPEQVAINWQGQTLEGAFEDVLLTRRTVLRIALLEAP